MGFITANDACEKYAFIFKSYGSMRVMLHKNINGIRDIALKIGQQTFFDEDTLLEWIKSQSYTEWSKKNKRSAKD
jgi:hypothetical protein